MHCYEKYIPYGKTSANLPDIMSTGVLSRYVIQTQHKSKLKRGNLNFLFLYLLSLQYNKKYCELHYNELKKWSHIFSWLS